MRADHFEKFAAVRTQLLAAEAAHPDSPALKGLHTAMFNALDSHGHLFTDDQFVALGGGTPKPE